MNHNPKNCILLVVEDSVDYQILLNHILKSDGHQVLCANNGQEALDMLRSMHVLPSLIFLDIMMPVMDGFVFRTEQKKDPRLASIPVAVMTADGQIETKKERLGVEIYLKKPADMNDILAVATRYC